MKVRIFFTSRCPQTKGRARHQRRKRNPSARALQTMRDRGLSTAKYAAALKNARMTMKSRCRTWPMVSPSRNRPAPVMSQNSTSVTVVTTMDRARRRTTRKMSYKKPAAAPRAREEAACSS